MRFKWLQISAINNLQVLDINATDSSRCNGYFKPIGLLACQYCSASTTTTTPAAGVQDKANAAENGNGILKRVLKKVGFTPNSKAVG